MEIGSETMAAVDGFFLFVSRFWSRRTPLYLGVFAEVGVFDLTKAAPAIRAELYGRSWRLPPYSCSLNSLEALLEAWLLWEVWKLVYWL